MGKHRNNLDLLRLLFASFVVVAHAYELIDHNRLREPLTRLFGTLSFGDLGVDFFFILSGFLITLSWQHDPHIWRYLGRRFRRIYPAYIVAFILSATVVGALGAADASVYLHGLEPAKLAWRMLWLHDPKTPPTFLGSGNPIVNASMWTLFFEFLCYLSLMAIGLSGLLKRWVVFSAFIIAAVWACYLHNDVGAGGDRYVVVRFALMFLSGMMFQLFRFHEDRPWWKIVAASLALIACASVPHLVEPAIATFGAYLILVAGFAPHKLSNLRKIPDVSYGLYLYGWPVEQLVIRYITHNPLLVIAISLPVAGLLALASWSLIEHPAMKLRLGSWHSRRLADARSL